MNLHERMPLLARLVGLGLDPRGELGGVAFLYQSDLSTLHANQK
ncbi:hypothetical protein ACTHR6_12410 [Ralstonia holmesii]|nr:MULTISPECIES: hypothetical protein [Ralstonia]